MCSFCHGVYARRLQITSTLLHELPDHAVESMRPGGKLAFPEAATAAISTVEFTPILALNQKDSF